MMRVRLPPIGLAIPPAWNATDEHKWLSMRAQAKRLASDVVVDERARDDADMLRPLLRARRWDDVEPLISSQRMAKALAWLWVETNGDCNDTVTSRLIGAVSAHGRTRSTTHLLGRLYFARFDALDAEEDRTVLDSLREALRVAPIAQNNRRMTGMVGALTAHAGVLLDRDAPRLVAHLAAERGATLDAVVTEFSIKGFMGGRFGELVRQYAILEELARASMDGPLPILEDVVRPEVHEADHRDGIMFGHAVIATMVEHARDEYPPPHWRRTVLEIAGDPRRSHTEQYRKWWAKLPVEYAEIVIRWIAVEELQLFLDALGKLADEGESDPMRRLFPPRKKLLEGLVREKRVQRSRLFVGSDARRALRGTSLATADLPVLTGNSQGDKVLLYLDCGDFHIVEGSHNTKLWTYLLSPPSYLTDPRRRSYSYRELTAGLADEFKAEHGNGSLKDIVHLNRWQYRFLGYLARNGVYVDPETVLDRQDYVDFRLSEHYPHVAAVARRAHNTNVAAPRE